MRAFVFAVSITVLAFAFRGGENSSPPVAPTTTQIQIVYVPLGAHDAMQDDLDNLEGGEK